MQLHYVMLKCFVFQKEKDASDCVSKTIQGICLKLS